MSYHQHDDSRELCSDLFDSLGTDSARKVHHNQLQLCENNIFQSFQQ